MHKHLALNVLKFRSMDGTELDKAKAFVRTNCVKNDAIRELIEETRPGDGLFETVNNYNEWFELGLPQVDTWADLHTALKNHCTPETKKRKLPAAGSSSDTLASEVDFAYMTLAHDVFVEESKLAEDFDLKRGNTQHDAYLFLLSIFRQFPKIEQVFEFWQTKLTVRFPTTHLIDRFQKLLWASLENTSNTSAVVSDISRGPPSKTKVNHLQLSRSDEIDVFTTAGAQLQHADGWCDDSETTKCIIFEKSSVAEFGNAFVIQLKICSEDQSKQIFLKTEANQGKLRQLTDSYGKVMYLVAMIAHIGPKITSGHYITYLMFADKVTVADDSVESERDDGDPYLLFYAPRRIKRAEYSLEGLSNYGGSVCFMNATIQALRMVQACGQTRQASSVN